MSISFSGGATLPDGYVAGVIGVAPGSPFLNEIQATAPAQTCGPQDALLLKPDTRSLLLDHTLALKDDVARADAAIALELLRRRRGSALLLSHEPELLRWLCDEIWWIDGDQIRAKGDPTETLEHYRRHTAQTLINRAAGSNLILSPTRGRGDGRAELESIETLDGSGQPTAVWQTDHPAQVRVTVRFHHAVADPVVGILIRTRIGFEVYGTNTELEKVKLGPCSAGERLTITFQLPCMLCPGEYTLTAASHDPDGVWHDWVEDGIAFSVADYRYTAGVACLRATVAVSRDTQ